MPLEEPSDNAINDLTHVYFGRPSDLDPDNENYNHDNDLQYDEVQNNE